MQQHSDAALSVTGVCADSRAVRRGDAFFALPGVHVHGNRFVDDAVARGAAMLVTDTRPDKDPGVPVIVVPDVRAAFAKAAARSVGALPSTLVGVTGTNGKTSVVSFVRQIWNHCGIASASLGTLGVDTGHRIEGGSLTTPDSLTLAHQLAALKADGIDHVAMEASSHGLDQRRLDGLAFKAVGFTNLTRDHLDYHETFDNYREAKLRLFRDLLADGGAAVVNTDDPEHLPFMFAALERGATLLTVGSEGAFISVDEVTSEALGQRVRGRLVGEPMDFHLPLAGQFQVSNALVAVALAIAGGAPQERAVAALEHLKGAKGRLELAGRKGDVAVFIDYAHTPDALKTALEALRPFARSKVTVVFGCGGDRDKGKRPLMGAIASDLADRVIVTDDNPRSEDAATIRREILAEAPGAEEIGDRAEAIRAAVAGARQGDVVLVAGKGHEDYQIVGETRLHFSDHETVRVALEG
ncbi:MAG TPA: UDP-N-acetylmuramoyl-L-alanyl-D-glutamate--2,6-diaminopimelate ligase [Devosiaceae bacterium]